MHYVTGEAKYHHQCRIVVAIASNTDVVQWRTYFLTAPGTLFQPLAYIAMSTKNFFSINNFMQHGLILLPLSSIYTAYGTSFLFSLAPSNSVQPGIRAHFHAHAQ